jgi:hypothetical protein
LAVIELAEAVSVDRTAVAAPATVLIEVDVPLTAVGVELSVAVIVRVTLEDVGAV